MSYATPEQFAALGLPEAALDGFTGDVQDYLDAAFGRINSYLRGRYRLPLAEPYPPEIIQAECWLAAFDLISIRGFDPEAGANKNIVDRYRHARDWLKSLAAGRVNLELESDATPSASDGGPIVRSRARGRTGARCSTCGSCSGCRCGFWGNAC